MVQIQSSAQGDSMEDILILNRNYFAVHITDWQRAITLVYTDKADVIDEDYRRYNFNDWVELSKMIKDSPSGFIHTPTLKIAMPEVIALKFYDELPEREVKFTRKNLYHHYKFKCCYCGKRLQSEQLNLDHVIPRSKGGNTDWNNIVLSCINCNIRKADNTPNQANLKMYYQPSKPLWRPAYFIGARPAFIKIKSSWKKFVDTAYWNIELEKD